jgi:hypothetical protein
MKNLKLIGFYLLVMFVCGCVPSLHPLFTKEQAVSTSDLMGVWLPGDSNEIWEFKPGEKGCEGIYVDEKGKAGKFNVIAGKLAGNLFLDIAPIDSSMPENDFYKIHMVPTHTFLKAELKNGSLGLRAMNPEILDKLLKADPKIIQHERLDNGTIILTASSQELQNFILKYSDEKYELFGKAKQASKQK